MRLNEKALENRADWKGYKLYSYDRAAIRKNTEERPEWVHFGAGNIFRIFPAGLCQRLLEKGEMDTGIVVGEGFDFEIIDDIYKKHDCLTAGVTLKANGTIEKEIIGSVMSASKADPASEDWKTLKRAITNPSLRMISFTITEKGYALYAPDGSLFKGYQQDFASPLKDASMFLCRLTGLLNERYELSRTPIALCSMDNCSHNGEKLKNAMVTIARSYCEKGQLSQGFVDWIENEDCVSFPWSMIDKITPRPDASVKAMLEKDGFEDAEPIITSKHTYIAAFVNAEEPQYLVIEDRFPNGRPALEKAGVYFCDRETVNKVERMKVCTCLNPLHTALAVSGCLLGYNLIADEMKDEDLKKMVEILGYKEGLPVVTDPGILNPRAFIDEVLGVRIPNPFMPDTPQRIATDTSQKLSIRIGETIKAYQESDKLDVKSLKVAPLVYALWMRYMLAVDDEGKEFALSPDPMTTTVQPMLEGIKLGDKGPFADKLSALLSNETIFGLDVTKSPLYEVVLADFEKLVAGPGAVRRTIHEVVNS
ncbi:MAG: mannitol dehydrogenase family protein [Spirochaetales bacterium]|nr:mannitol dehydrogenase family protein [Spirochaetales bacterium]